MPDKSARIHIGSADSSTAGAGSFEMFEMLRGSTSKMLNWE